MIERAIRAIPNRQSNLQKLTLFYGMQRRPILGACAQLTKLMADNPNIRMQLSDARIALNAALDVLKNEYERDRTAIVKQREVESVAGLPN